MTVKTHPDTPPDPIEPSAVNTIRTLSIDAVQAANSGYPGTGGLAPVTYRPWQDYRGSTRSCRCNRDRFVHRSGTRRRAV
jgi:transketolase